MITAHVPSGYVPAHAQGWSGPAFAAAIPGAVVSDLDLVDMHAVDPATNHHQTNRVHAPVFVFLASIAVIAAAGRHPIAVAFMAAWVLRVLLDSPTRGMMWAGPFGGMLYHPIRMHTNESDWLLVFLTHWTVVSKLTVWFTALVLFIEQPRQKA